VWLKGIGERNLILAQPHTVFGFVVNGDWRKESQFSPTTPRIWVLVKRD